MSKEIRILAFDAQHSAALADLCRCFGVRRLEMFGSAAAGNDDATSDVDFLVEFDALPAGTHADAYFGPLEALEGLAARPVDVA